ncbi:MAG: hypothetical protein ACOH2H_03080 [Cypionkella sp.]
MRFLILSLFLTGCSAYPRLDWPAGVATAPAPPLVPQSQVLTGTVAKDTGPAVVARAAALRSWAASVAR